MWGEMETLNRNERLRSANDKHRCGVKFRKPSRQHLKRPLFLVAREQRAEGKSQDGTARLVEFLRRLYLQSGKGNYTQTMALIRGEWDPGPGGGDLQVDTLDSIKNSGP